MTSSCGGGAEAARRAAVESQSRRIPRGGASASAPSLAREGSEVESALGLMFDKGSPVRLEGMTNRRELNGSLAEIVTPEPDELGRVRVQLKSIVPGKVMRVRPERLHPDHGSGVLWVGMPKAKPESHGIANDRARDMQEFLAFEQRVGLGLPLLPPRPICKASRRGFERTFYGGIITKGKNPFGN
mmetsp:Transcript_69884/g.167751  ORF Transcript_69884/g.167751 Transcript_69884/m.167751 type:complete len:186 (+) Transcript_69884:90-647(+)